MPGGFVMPLPICAQRRKWQRGYTSKHRALGTKAQPRRSARPASERGCERFCKHSAWMTTRGAAGQIVVHNAEKHCHFQRGATLIACTRCTRFWQIAQGRPGCSCALGSAFIRVPIPFPSNRMCRYSPVTALLCHSIPAIGHTLFGASGRLLHSEERCISLAL